MMWHRARRRSSRFGYTLVELMVASASSLFLLAGMGSSIFFASKAFDESDGEAHKTIMAGQVVNRVMFEMQYATRFYERTPHAVTFAVPDRDGDGSEEKFRYAWSGVPGDPLTKELNGSAPSVLLKDIHGINFTYMTRTVIAPPPPVFEEATPLLFVVNNAASLTSGESARKSLMEGWGYTVTLISDDDSQANFDAVVVENDVAYIPVGISDSILGTKLTNATVGIVNEANSMHFNLGLQNGGSSTYNASLINILDVSHYVTEVFATGNLTICSTTQVLNKSSGNLGAARILAAVADGTPTLETLEPGDPLKGVGGTAAGRRIFLPWGGDTFDFNSLNTDGQTLMQRAIEWAAASGGGSPDANFGYETQFASMQNNVKNLQIATQVTLTEDGTLNSITAYVYGANQKVRYAIYSDSSGEPGSLIVETDAMNFGGTSDWHTASVTPTVLTAGTYWLALSFENGNARYHYTATGGQTRYVTKDAAKNGYLPTWGTSTASYPRKISIYGTYTPAP